MRRLRTLGLALLTAIGLCTTPAAAEPTATPTHRVTFDKYSVILEANNQEQLIFKHAISTVTTAKMPMAPPPPNKPARRCATSSRRSKAR